MAGLDFYFSPKKFEKGGKVYKKLGVTWAQGIIMGTTGKVIRTLGMDNRANSYFIGKDVNEASLREYERGTRLNEAVHTPQVLLDIAMFAHNLDSENYGMATMWFGLLIGNLYCSMVQRYCRARVYDVLEKRYKQYFLKR